MAVAVVIAALAVATPLLRGVPGGILRTPAARRTIAPTVASATTPYTACEPSSVTRSANARDVRLATALMDAHAGDYRPRQTVIAVHAGQPAYLTFRVDTAARGDVMVTICTRDGRYQGHAPIPPGSRGRFVAFPTAFTPEDRGPGVALVTWDGVPVAVASFTVVE